MTTFGFDPVGEAVAALLEAVETGSGLPPRPERVHLELKEEVGRRGPSGTVAAGQPTNDQAAGQLARAGACMSNTDGPGAIVVGISNTGDLIGTSLDTDWLRARIYELTDRALTVHLDETYVNGIRLLVLRPPQAVEPIRWKGRIYWRIDDRCVEVDLASWHERRMVRTHYDWSAQESVVPVEAVRAAGIEVARELLRNSGERAAAELAAERDQGLLRRLNVVTSDGMLTNAGALVFHGRDQACLDYLHRERAGGDSTARVRSSGRSLLEELNEVFLNIAANNPVRHRRHGLVIGQEREIPERAAREAVVNGVAHRTWASPDPTTVEHVGRTLRVTSPGGFFGGVNEQNIITHPSLSRNRALTELLRSLRIAEREGIGVDRMVGDMIGAGYDQPSIRQITGPFVRTSLVADVRDEAWIAWLAELQPASTASDLNVLLLLRHLDTSAWVDLGAATRIVQLDELETRGALALLESLEWDTGAVVVPVDGAPSGADLPLRLSDRAAARLLDLSSPSERARRRTDRRAVALAYARARGRISSTELASIVHGQRPNVTGLLRELEEEGQLVPAFPSRRGRGFHYLPADT